MSEQAFGDALVALGGVAAQFGQHLSDAAAYWQDGEEHRRAEQRAADARFTAEMARLRTELADALALLYPLYHTNAPDPCGGIAFYTTRRLSEGDVLDSTTVRLADGTAPINGATDMVCGACGQLVGVGSVAYETGAA